MTPQKPDKTPARTGRKNPAPAKGAEAGPENFDPGRADAQADFIVVCGPDDRILYVNPACAAALGYAAGSMAGTPLFPYIAETFRDTMAANLAALRNTSEPPFYETSLLTAGGHTRSVIVKGKPVLYHSAPASLLFLIDITERKALEDQLAARADELMRISTALRLANRKLTLLTSITRHDIDNQLTGLKFFVQVLEEEVADPGLKEYCRKAEIAADRIAAMIRFTREYEEIGITSPAWQDAKAVVDAAAVQAPLKQVRLENGIPAGIEVLADPLIAKVFYNLMDNAVRYGQTITTIRFSVEQRDGTLLVVCQDDGAGVPADEKERIFDRGFGKNTGLGLALSREILDITGLTIAETGTPGAGARFEIAVPQASWRARPAPE